MTDENKPETVQKARLSMDNIIYGHKLNESRISFDDISVGNDSRISYANISNQSKTSTKKTNEK